MSAQPHEDAGAEPGKGGAHEIHFKVDGEFFETTKRELTPNEIIKDFAHKDPATHYLVQIEGHHRESFQGKGDVPIKMHDGMKFQVISTGPRRRTTAAGTDGGSSSVPVSGPGASSPGASSSCSSAPDSSG